MSERQSLKIKRQIVHFGCNYCLKRPSGEKKKERGGIKNKPQSLASITGGQVRERGSGAHPWGSPAPCPPPPSLLSCPSGLSPSGQDGHRAGCAGDPGQLSWHKPCNHTELQASFGTPFSHEYTGIVPSLNTSVLGFTWRQLCSWNAHLGQMLLDTKEDEDSRGMAGWMSQDTSTS